MILKNDNIHITCHSTGVRCVTHEPHAVNTYTHRYSNVCWSWADPVGDFPFEIRLVTCDIQLVSRDAWKRRREREGERQRERARLALSRTLMHVCGNRWPNALLLKIWQSLSGIVTYSTVEEELMEPTVSSASCIVMFKCDTRVCMWCATLDVLAS